MVIPFSRLASGTKVLLFGPQALAFNQESFEQLRSTLLGSPDFRWALDAVAELPGYWSMLSKSVSRLQNIPGAELLQNLSYWLSTGKTTQDSFPLPNILLTPLVVITHLTQYSRLLELAKLVSKEPQNLHASFTQNAETAGICTGLLSALAVSSSASQAELQHYGPVAIRLAMLVGAIVDSRDTLTEVQEHSVSLSVAWSSPESGTEVAEILKSFPEAGLLSWQTRPEHLFTDWCNL
ncbi:hypothetical protein AOQ84DRAFT_283717 [Glonium stellatum]|uniref:Starter acyltransferase (SAT) domain-containing protein n=1 Tax=Glonium stellatum TaxID=574774 RepID=A0A8E2F9M7_9PEZI|nr:hypothetical protein AOQ84DRAFT_283717 [Glonium stellatum]